MPILFLDDDRWAMKYHILALRDCGYSVEVRSNVNRALSDFAAYLQEPNRRWDGIVLDVVMPPGELSAACPDGMNTGVEVLRRLRAMQPNLPALVMTNSRDEDILSQLRSMDVRIVRKLDALPPELVKHANDMFGAPR
jgi:CheY-like chemotaxis protein